MSKTSEVQPNPNGEPSPEKDNLFTKAARKLGEVALYTWRVVTGRGSDEQAKDISGTIAPEVPVKSGDTSPIANTVSEEQLKSLEGLGVKVITTPEYPKPSLPKSVTTPDGRQYPFYPKSSLPEPVTKSDGNRSPVESGNTPAALIELPKPSDIHGDEWRGFVGGAAAKYLNSVKPSTSEEQASDSTEDASGSSAEKNIPVSEPPKPSLPESVTTPDGRQYPEYPKPSLPKSVTKPDGRQYPAEIEPPKPTPLDILIDKRKGEAAAAKYSSPVNPDVYTRVKGENVIDKDMFSTTIPNVDKPKKDDNPEGLTPYEQAMRYKYLGDEYDDAEKTEMSPEEHEAAANLKIARERFAKASIAAESHFFGKKKRQEALEAAAKELKERELEYMRLKFADKIEAAKQDPEKQTELAAEMAQAAFASMQETSRMTTDKYDSMLDDRGKFKKAAAKVGKWFNKGGKIAQWLKLGGTGLVVGTATGTFAGIAGWPITTAVGVVTKLGVAGATKQAVLEEHRGEDRIDADASLGTIDPSFEKAVANMKIDDVMKRAVNVSVDNLKGVSTERRDALRKKVLSSSGKYAVGFVLGGVVGSFINDWWANSAHATGPEGSADTTPQSGDDQIPQSGNKPLIDNPAAKTIGNSVNPDTPNFSSYDYPWNWAAEKFGDANAMDQLHNLADKAMADGHTVEWYNTGGIEYLEVDGSSATEHVLDVLSRYV
ncbi:hypothetical protein LRM44_01420 [Candidatus Nanosynbacter sp. HMT-352]|uniref:hypothetical protein n=1 Tax=Candidatus Nanosynbacter sp. HMT-352 TaxID=2899133 RepID=UPI001FB73627|nr:hypothetical protein [Candidatus Nanosynbacter sp. HMT-352]UOG66706.1 hypothetical protein LRM44_01420 [Candidatus Nanosynbacter sp. HMT-352]